MLNGNGVNSWQNARLNSTVIICAIMKLIYIPINIIVGTVPLLFIVISPMPDTYSRYTINVC